MVAQLHCNGVVPGAAIPFDVSILRVVVCDEPFAFGCIAFWRSLPSPRVLLQVTVEAGKIHYYGRPAAETGLLVLKIFNS